MIHDRNPAVRRYRSTPREAQVTRRAGGSVDAGSRQAGPTRWRLLDWRMGLFALCVLGAAGGVWLATAPASRGSARVVAAAPATFGVDLAGFRRAFDQAATDAAPASADSGAIVSCDPMPDGSDACAPSDVGFQRLVGLMRASGLTDHALRQKITVVARRAADGCLESIEVDGTRADRANQLRFSDVVADVAAALSGGPSGSNASLSDLLIRLMAGDSDRSINEPIFAATAHAKVECLRARSGVSLAMRCIFHPV